MPVRSGDCVFAATKGSNCDKKSIAGKNHRYLHYLKTLFIYLMALAYIAAGINHFVHPGPYVAIMPPCFSKPALLVLVSGVAEVVLGVLLLVPGTRSVAAWGLILLLVAVFPANVQMMLNYRATSHPHLWLSVLRLPVQVLLIWWSYQYTKPRKVCRKREQAA